MPQNIIYNVQTLRGISALAVVLGHSVGTAKWYQLPVDMLQNFSFWGASGVDVFFVISGFIIAYTAHFHPKSAKRFLYDRIVRIVPLYWVLMCLILFLLMFLPQAFRTTDMSMIQILASFFFVSQLTHSGSFPLIGAGWSLEYELLFYALFSLGLIFKKLPYTFLFAGLSLLLVAAINMYSLIVVELIMGMVIGWLYVRYTVPLRWAMGILALGIGLLSLSFFFRLPEVVSREVYFGIPAALIVTGSVYTPQICWPLGQLLGNASYSIYLIQFFTIPVFYKSMAYIQLNQNLTYVACCLCLLFTVLVGVVCHFYLEKPLTFIFNRQSKRSHL